jgi:sulfur carrier protein
MMKILVNDRENDIDAGTIADVVNILGYQGLYFAVALNMTCIPRSQYAKTRVMEGDKVEILMPMQGG